MTQDIFNESIGTLILILIGIIVSIFGLSLLPTGEKLPPATDEPKPPVADGNGGTLP